MTNQRNLQIELQGIVDRLPKAVANGQYQEREAMLAALKELKRKYTGDDIREWRESQIKWNGLMFSITWERGKFVVKTF